jgi:hypothetical protein
MHLYPDGRAKLESAAPNGLTYTEKATWEYVDQRHWKLRLDIPPDPDTPGLEDGAIDVADYEVIAFDGSRMELMKFDYESPFVYEKKPNKINGPTHGPR